MKTWSRPIAAVCYTAFAAFCVYLAVARPDAHAGAVDVVLGAVGFVIGIASAATAVLKP